MATSVREHPCSVRWTLIGVIIVGHLLTGSPARAQTTSKTISDDIQKGNELLDSKDDVQRIGGIYVLGKAVAQGDLLSQRQGDDEHVNYETLRNNALDALCDFVRGQTVQPSPLSQDILPIDVQTALTEMTRPERLFPSMCDLHQAHLEAANLPGAHLMLVNLLVANLTSANLIGADLTNAKLGGAQLKSARLIGAFLFQADLTRADLQYADLRAANLRGADLSGVQHLTQEQLDSACGDEKTKLDPPLTIKPCPKN